jgi:hypothetical protein
MISSTFVAVNRTAYPEFRAAINGSPTFLSTASLLMTDVSRMIMGPGLIATVLLLTVLGL